jgi:hypothetical protein
MDLKMFESTCIFQLDSPIKFDIDPQVPMPSYLWENRDNPREAFPRTLTLRQVLMGLPFPLPNGPVPGQKDENGATSKSIKSTFGRF